MLLGLLAEAAHRYMSIRRLIILLSRFLQREDSGRYPLVLLIHPTALPRMVLRRVLLPNVQSS